MGEKDVHNHVREGLKNTQYNSFPVSLVSSKQYYKTWFIDLI